MTAITEFSLKQKMLFDFKRMSIVYPAALAVGIGLMALQSISGIQIFTFDRAHHDDALPVSAPANIKPPPDIQSLPIADVERITTVLSQAQRSIDVLDRELQNSKSQLEALSSDNAVLKARLKTFEETKLLIDERRFNSLDLNIARLTLQQRALELRQSATMDDMALASATKTSTAASLNTLLRQASQSSISARKSRAKASTYATPVGGAPLDPQIEMQASDALPVLPGWTETVAVPYTATITNFTGRK